MSDERKYYEIPKPIIGAFGYRMKFAIPHIPRKIENKPNSKRVQRAIMLKEFMDSK